MRSHFGICVVSAAIVAISLFNGQGICGDDRKALQEKQLASVDGAVITEKQARAENAAKFESLELQRLKEDASYAMNEHQILQDAVERILEDKLLRAEAAKQGVSKEELIARDVDGKITEPTAEEIDSFYEENQDRIQGSKEEVAPRIAKYLRQQKQRAIKQSLLGRLEKEHKVTRSIEPLRFNVDAPGRPALGPSAAPVVLVLFSDFQCPYCKGMSETLKEILKNYGDKVRLVFRQFPLISIHQFAEQAAEASLCADAQGHFWEMHDSLFANQEKLAEADIKDRAVKLGLDTAAFNSCLDGQRFAARVKEDIRGGASAGTEGTPAIYVNGRFLNGNRPYEDIASLIDEELRGKK
jgi:protein-disulfide isomerase